MEVLLVLFFVFLITYLIFYFKFRKLEEFVFKIVTSLLFVVLGFVFYFKDGDKENILAFRILAGLVFGLMGDIFLALKRNVKGSCDLCFKLGLGSFFIGHIFYISIITNDFRYEFIIAAVLAITVTYFVITSVKRIKLDYLKMKKYVFLYIFISSFLLASALVNLIGGNIMLNFIWIFASLSFIVSDFLLAIILFGDINYLDSYKGKKSRMIKRISILTYYSAQILFATSILLI